MAQGINRTVSRARPRKFKQERIDQVIGMLQNMIPYHMIKKQLAEKWGCGREMVGKYIHHVHEVWAEEAALIAGQRRHQIRVAYETLYMKFLSSGDDHDLKMAMAALRELSFLDGVNAQVPGAIQNQVQVAVGLNLASLGFQSPEQVRARVEELRARIKEEGGQTLTGPQFSPPELIEKAMDAPIELHTVKTQEDDGD